MSDANMPGTVTTGPTIAGTLAQPTSLTGRLTSALGGLGLTPDTITQIIAAVMAALTADEIPVETI